MGIKERIIMRLEKEIEYTAGYIDLRKLSDEERERCFNQFGEGDENLTQFLKTAYNHGAPSMFCCSGHGKSSPYVMLQVTDENLELLRKIGRAVSKENVATNFREHHLFGRNVIYRAHKHVSTDWLKLASQVMQTPELYDDINPDIYYHEEIKKLYKPFGFDLKKKILSFLRGDRKKLPNRKSRRTNRRTKTTIMET